MPTMDAIKPSKLAGIRVSGIQKLNTNQVPTPNTTDNEHKRYRFGNQPEIALWNLYQLANALYPLIEEAKPLEAILNSFQSQFEKEYLDMMCSKLGFQINSK